MGYTKITPEQGKKMMEQDKTIVLLDVRMQQEYDNGHIQGAKLLPDFMLEKNAEKELPNKEATIIVYCLSGGRSYNAAQDLLEMGYSNIYDMGGISSWPYEIVR